MKPTIFATRMRIGESTPNARNDRTSFCGIKTQAWPALDNPAGKEKIVHAGDACFRCHESQKLANWTWKVQFASILIEKTE
ncbi:hypothetical protein DJ88_4419 [Bacillus paralicheniformis]|nr:hypothetical protein DJ88_4419 [Bacillus paralicheniformis]